jgi:hypothetical protein
MAANAKNRKTVRADLVTLFAGLVGVSKPVQSVENGPVEFDLKKNTPYITVASGGSARKHSGINDTRWFNTFKLEVTTFVRRADVSAGWTELMVEDTLDDVDKAIADIIADNRVSGSWSFIGFSSDPGGEPDMSEIVTDTARGCVMEVRSVYVHYVETGA